METHGISPVSADNTGLSQNYKMIDIAEKKDTLRRAVASGIFSAQKETIAHISNRTLPKGDVLALAEIAGIQGAKRTSDLLPLCHPLSLTSVRVWMELSEESIRVFCEAKTIGKTGVEMEALCGVNAALLCIYDLAKGIDPVLKIGGILLEIKEGGKSGTWKHPESSYSEKSVCSHSNLLSPPLLSDLHAAVITMSDRCSRNDSEDLSGPAARLWLESKGAHIKEMLVLPDDSDRLQTEVLRILDKNPPQLILTTGGTGLSQRDITPETLLKICRELNGREVRGIGELLRQSGAKHTDHSWLSRSTAMIIQKTLIVCLPGSPRAVQEGLDAIGKLIGHCLHIAEGGNHS